MLKKCILLSIALIVWWVVRAAPQRMAASSCTFTAFDIGQGDSLYIRTSDGQDILIDGGPDDMVVQKLGKYLPPGDRDLELVVLTHPHADHVNGLVAVAKTFTITSVLLTDIHFHQAAYEAWLAELQRQHVAEHVAVAGQSYRVGTATLDVLWPARNLSHDTIEHDNAAQGGGVNDSSIVLKLTCAGSQAMLMGDASSDIEQRILDRGTDIHAVLLKVGHHGSRFSSSPALLKAVGASIGVISAGVNNRYHHPHPTTLLHLQLAHVHVLRTDLQGDIRLMTDGRGGWRTTP